MTSGTEEVARYEPVLGSKLRAPDVLGTTVRRTRLLEAMDAAGERGCVFTLIAAPPGAGKTTLMTQRAADLRSAGVPVAWLSLDVSDNDPTAFWAGVLASFAKAISEENTVVREAMKELDPPARPGDRRFLATLFAIIEQLPRGLYLALDDVHELDFGDTSSELRLLLTNAPPELSVGLGCRQDPHLPMPRLVLEGRAWEIRADELAFDRDEARELLAGHDVVLSEPDLDRLLRRTEGWAAGLRLAAMSLSNHRDESGYIASFAGDDRPVVDYLISEVLNFCPPETEALLLATAVLDVVEPELAAELSGRSDAGQILDGLARENSLVHRLSSTPASYRYHPLLRGFLQAELGRRDAGAARRLQSIATKWYASHDSPLAAITSAAQQRDWERVAAIIDQDGLRLLLTGQSEGLDSALDTLPLGDDRPSVSLIRALAALQGGRLDLATGFLEQIGRDPSVHSDERTRLLHLATLMFEVRATGLSDPEVVTPLARAGEGERPVADPLVNVLATANRAMLQTLIGESVEAERDLRAAMRQARHHGLDSLVLDGLTHLASVARLDDYGRLDTLSRRAIAFAEEHGLGASSRMPQAYAAAAWASWQTMDVSAAAKYFSRGRDIETDVPSEIRLWLQAVGLLVEHGDAADLRSVRKQLRSVWAETPFSEVSTSMICALSLIEVQIALSFAEPAWAAEAARRAERYGGRPGDALVMSAWIHLYYGRQEVAARVLAPVLSGELGCRLVSSEITAWLLEAHIASSTGETFQLQAAVERAVELAAPRRAMRDLARASSQVRAHLIQSLGRFGPHDHFVAQVLELTNSGQNGTGTVAGDALTARELEILRELPSMLTLEEIAEAQLVSVNTVKTHVKGLYRKLLVSSRREAVERARELGLL